MDAPLNANAFRTKMPIMQNRKFTPQPRPNLTIEQRADLITRLERSANNPSLPPEERASRAKLAVQLRRIQAKRAQQQDATTPKPL